MIESGTWVFINVNRDAFCPDGDPDQAFVGQGSFQLVMTAQAPIVRVSARDAPAWLYEITGPLPEDDDIEELCKSIGSEAVAQGAVNLRANDNEASEDSGTRANSFGARAQGTLDELADGGPTGRRYRLSWVNRIVIPTGESFDPIYVRAEHVNLKLVGTGS